MVLHVMIFHFFIDGWQHFLSILIFKLLIHTCFYNEVFANIEWMFLNLLCFAKQFHLMKNKNIRSMYFSPEYVPNSENLGVGYSSKGIILRN